MTWSQFCLLLIFTILFEIIFYLNILIIFLPLLSTQMHFHSLSTHLNPFMNTIHVQHLENKIHHLKWKQSTGKISAKCKWLNTHTNTHIHRRICAFNQPTNQLIQKLQSPLFWINSFWTWDFRYSGWYTQCHSVGEIWFPHS